MVDDVRYSADKWTSLRMMQRVLQIALQAKLPLTDILLGVYLGSQIHLINALHWYSSYIRYTYRKKQRNEKRRFDFTNERNRYNHK